MFRGWYRLSVVSLLVLSMSIAHTFAQLSEPLYAVYPNDWKFLRYNEILLLPKTGAIHYRFGEVQLRSAAGMQRIPLRALPDDQVFKPQSSTVADTAWMGLLRSDTFHLAKGTNYIELFRCCSIDRFRTHYACLHNDEQSMSARLQSLPLSSSTTILLQLVDARSNNVLTTLDSMSFGPQGAAEPQTQSVLRADEFQCSTSIGSSSENSLVFIRVRVRPGNSNDVRIEAAQHQSYANQKYIHESQRKARRYETNFSEISFPQYCQWQALQVYLDSLKDALGSLPAHLPQHPAEKYMFEFRDRYQRANDQGSRTRSRSVFDATSDLSVPWIVSDSASLLSTDSLKRFHSSCNLWLVYNPEQRLDSAVFRSSKPVFQARLLALDSTGKVLERNILHRDLAATEVLRPSALFHKLDAVCYVAVVDGDRRLLGLGRLARKNYYFEQRSASSPESAKSTKAVKTLKSAKPLTPKTAR